MSFFQRSIIASASLTLSVVAAASAAPRAELLDQLGARPAGGSVPGGRAMTIAAVQSQPDTLYVGGATSGVWKTNNGGASWRPLFDTEDTASIGAISIFQPDPNIVWVGTGEPKPRYGTGVGTGVFKSSDGGETWTKMGLEKSERIQRVVLHPENPEIAYVAAVGPAYTDGEERGVFKTVDGGKSWTRVLFTHPGAGAADLAMDPENPDRLLAAMWRFRRKPWDFNSGGEGSGIFISEDAGETWTRLSADAGLPADPIGRTGFAFDPADSQRVFAAVEASKSGLYLSEDGGRSWSLHNDDPDIFGHFARPWYCQELAVDPNNPDFLYYSVYVSLSKDGGRSFVSSVRDRGLLGVAETHQALFIKSRPGHIYVATDQGLIHSRDSGATWERFDNLPFAQYYQISVDMEDPYNIYGNMQDMADWRAASAALIPAPLIPGSDWFLLAGGEQGHVYPHPEDASVVYTSHQQGQFQVQNLKTRSVRTSVPTAERAGAPLRFNVHTAQATDPFDGDTVYLGSQFVHRSKDRGEHWQIISPDLTTNDPAKQRAERAPVGGLTHETGGGERHTALVVIAPSTVKRGVIWTGSDDGKVFVTRNHGRRWEDVTDAIPDVPEGSWVNHIEPSQANPGHAYLVIDNHRRGDLIPYVYATRDYGESWQRIVEADAVRGNAYVLIEDPVQDQLLFLGTEFGLYLSLDGGTHWQQWRKGLPTVSVRDLVIHPREDDLVIGTFGRGLFIIDDISPLRLAASDPAFLTSPAAVAPIKAVAQRQLGFQGALSPWDSNQAVNRHWGAAITYVGNGAAAQSATIQITDSAGNLIDTLAGSNQAGLNRVHWDLRHAEDQRTFNGWQSRWSDVPGPMVLPGEYIARVNIEGSASQQRFTVMADPDNPVDRKTQAARLALQRDVGQRLLAADAAYAHLGTYIETLETFLTTAQKEGLSAEDTVLLDGLETARNWIFWRGIQRSVYAPPSAEGVEAARGLYTLRSELESVYTGLDATPVGPAPHHLAALAEADRRAQIIWARVRELNRAHADRIAALAPIATEVPVLQLPEYPGPIRPR